MVVSHWLVCTFSFLFIKIKCKFREIYSRVERKSHNQIFHAVSKLILGMSWKYHVSVESFATLAQPECIPSKHSYVVAMFMALNSCLRPY